MDQIIVKNQNDTNQSILKKCFTVKNFAKKNADMGAWPGSESAIWALRAGSPENGFGESFVSIGRRVLIDEKKFWEAVARLQEKKNVSK